MSVSRGCIPKHGCSPLFLRYFLLLWFPPNLVNFGLVCLSLLFIACSRYFQHDLNVIAYRRSIRLAVMHSREPQMPISSMSARRRLLRTKEAAAYLSVSPWKLRRLIQDGKLPVVQDGDAAPFLLDVRDLDSYIDRNKRILPF